MESNSASGLSCNVWLNLWTVKVCDLEQDLRSLFHLNLSVVIPVYSFLSETGEPPSLIDFTFGGVDVNSVMPTPHYFSDHYCMAF